MTPKEEFAAKRLEAESLIRQHAPQRLQEQLISLLRPAIALTATRTDDAHIPVGASKFGGAPDVPADFVWPMWNDKPLGFLAQINLEEVAAFDVDRLLPKSGLLSFFYDVDEPEFTDVSTPGSWRVSFFDNVEKRTSIERETGFHSALIHFSGGWSSPQTVDVPPENDHWQWQSACESSPCSSTGERPYQGHQMLGYGSPVTSDASWFASWRSRGDGEWRTVTPTTAEVHEWILLFQLDSDEEIGTMWGDVGTLFFLIKKEDLAMRAFERVWMELQFT